MKRPGDHVVINMWVDKRGYLIREILPGIVIEADPPTGEGDDLGQWVTALTSKGRKAQFMGM